MQRSRVRVSMRRSSDRRSSRRLRASVARAESHALLLFESLELDPLPPEGMPGPPQPIWPGVQGKGDAEDVESEPERWVG